MSSEPPAPTEGAIPPPESRPGAPKRRWPLAVLVAAVLVIAAGIGAYLLLPSAPKNQPPVAAFSFTVEGLSVDFEASGSHDPDGRILEYDWDFGDGVIDTGLAVTHRYAAVRTYNVTLTVADDQGTTGKTTQEVTLSNLPVAKFAVDRDRMSVQVDASASYAPAGTITAYAWAWGDAATGAGLIATHAYAVPGKYTIGLTVTDDRGSTASATRITSVANRTLDLVLYDFFNVSFGEWWTLREAQYGDRLLSTEFPCYSLSPWAGEPDSSDVFVYSMYRMAVRGRNLTEFTLEQPAMLPRFGDPSVHGDRVDVHWYAQYIDSARRSALDAKGFNVSEGYMDGFPEEWQYNWTMDYNSSRRFFNVSGDPSAWWDANTVRGPSKGPLEARWQAWYEDQGNRVYDIFNAFEATYVMLQFDVNATVWSSGGTNYTSLNVLLVAWGQEVLTARWFYWGTGSYPNGTPVARSGWWPQEVSWFEDFTFDGTLYRDHMDMDWDAALAYQFDELALPGPDGQYKTADDEPVWSWYPQLMDYLYPDVQNPKGELGAWINPATNQPYKTINAHPGNPYYGEQYSVDQAYAAWDLRAGETLTIIMPKQPIVFHDPVHSTWNPDPRTRVPDFVNITAPVTLRRMSPAGVGVWDEVSRTLYIAGPVATGGSTPPLDGLPRIDFGPKR